MPNWTANQIRFIGNRNDIVSVLKLVIVGKEFLKSIKKDEFDLCKHVQSHPCYNDSDRKVCEKCEHGKFCPLLSPKGSDVSEWEMVKVNEYGLHRNHLKEGDVYFGILIPQPRGMFQGGTNEGIAKRNLRFGILDWYAKRMGITNHDEVLTVPWLRIYKCMDMDNKVEQYQRRLNEISLNEARRKKK